MLLSPLELLRVLVQRLEVEKLSRKSAQAIPYSWSTLPLDAEEEYVVGLPSCTCTWLQRYSGCCGLLLVHREQEQCGACGCAIEHVAWSTGYIKRLATVGRRLEPSRDLVDHTQRSRRPLVLHQSLHVRIGRDVVTTKYTPIMNELVATNSINVARVLVVASNVELKVWTPVGSKLVVWSDGVDEMPARADLDTRYMVERYVSTTPREPVIFSIAGRGTRFEIAPLDATSAMVLYELTTVTAADTTHIEPTGLVELYPEVRRVPGAMRSPTTTGGGPTASIAALVSAPIVPNTSILMHSSSSFVQPHRLRIRYTREHLLVSIENDPVLVFFNKRARVLHVYTGTNVYRLAVFLDKHKGQMDCYCMRVVTHSEMDDNERVTLEQMTARYGPLCPVVPIETLFLIHAQQEPDSWYEWTSVPMIDDT